MGHLHLFNRGNITGLLLISAVLMVSACTQTGTEALSSAATGKTDEPALGFENFKPGSEQDFIVNVGRRVYFTKQSASLSDVTRETLDLQANWLINNKHWLAKIQGFADDPRNNKRLSTKRAEAVLNYLVSRGVDPKRLWAKGYGRERLVRDCPDISCKALNRRVIVNLRSNYDDTAPQFAGN